ncbi:popeye domain-containing 2 isoform X1 [Lepisosteus oculatus]|uniref:Popeye domain cAMP effector 2 n=1 Tax=Lepisosteus oculatus TaxID=7918 RepID=W5M212_LEPOC|nr:PREDICTED: popeye domain-containing protein 2 isoform X1 [Lepisosteus oculatus]
MWKENSTLFATMFYGHPQCEEWSSGTEGAVYQLGNILFILGYMGGSGVFGTIYIFSLLAPGFLCYALWGWLDACGADIVFWSILLLLLCLLQLAHLIYRLRKDSFEEELDILYKGIYLPLEVPVPIFKEIVAAGENQVVSLDKDQNYALEGKTPIDRLSFLLSGRIRVSLEGQFLHYIFPYQFLDSPEWESLRPTEEGKFQVTLTAETDCRYITWRRKKLYLLLSRERYIARLFSVMLGNDITDKLYSLNDKLFAKSGVRLDIRLPSLYHVLAPSTSEADSEHAGGFAPANQKTPPQPGPRKSAEPGVSNPHFGPQPTDTELPGEDSTSLIVEDFADLTGSFMEYGSERDYLK